MKRRKDASELLAAQRGRVDLFRLVERLGVPVANHYTDLYIPVNDLTRRILARYPLHQSNATTFTNEVEGGRWFDVPFCYTPGWRS